MKKHVLIAIAVVLLVILVTVPLLPEEPTPTQTTTAPSGDNTAGPNTTTSSNATTITYPPPTTSIVVTPTGTSVITSPPPTTTLPPEPAVVRLYTCDVEKYEVYLALAAEYYAETGTEVLVLTPAEDQTCEEALTELLTSEAPPSIFCIHTEEMLKQLQPQLQDLTGSAAAQALYSDAFAYTQDGKMLALAADVAGSGILYNAALLAQPVGFTQTDIQSFRDLQYIFDYITANRSRLDVYALAAPDYMDKNLMQTLAGLFHDPAQLRSFVDLYVQNTTSRNSTTTYFLKGTTVFYIGGTEDYDTVSSLGGNNLGFLPAYAPGSNQMQCICNHYWAVNAAVSKVDAKASEAFLGWLVNQGSDGTPVDRLALLAPYRDATYYANALQKQLRSFLSTGSARVSWTQSGCVADTDAFAVALRAYVTSPSDETWAAISNLFME